MVVDTLRADALSTYGNEARSADGLPTSPHLDRLAAQGLVFERAYSTAPWTGPSLVSILTGLWPWEHGATRLLDPLPDALPTLAEELRARGWRTAGVTTNFVATARHGFDQGFERWDDSLAVGHLGSNGEAAVERLLSMASEVGPEEDLFLFALLFEPHYLYEAQPRHEFGAGDYAGSLRGDEPLTELRRTRSELDEDDAAFLRARYLGEVARADAALGHLLAGLDAQGLLDEAWIVFTADHGEEILDRGWIGHTVSLHDELVRVPLVVRPPRGVLVERRGARVEHPVSLVDLAATARALVGEAEEDAGFAESVRTDALPDRRYLYLHVDFAPALADATAREKRAHQWGVVDGREGLKWIVDHLGEPGPIGRLFDLDRDPGETEALGDEGARELMRLRGLKPEPLDGRPGGEEL